MTMQEQISHARELLAMPESWTTGHLALNRPYGQPSCGVHPGAADARCFCLIGAAARAIGVREGGDAFGDVAASPLGKLLAHVIAGREFVVDMDVDKQTLKVQQYIRAGQHVTPENYAMLIYRFNDSAYVRTGGRAEAHADILSVLDEAELHAHAAGV